MDATFSKGQRVHGEYRGQFYKGIITNVTARDTDMVVSVKLDSEIVVKGEPMPREKFMTAVNENGDFTASAYRGYMALVSEDIQPADVDQGGDFEGFLEAVNAEPTPAQENVWYTEPVTSADGEQIKARVTPVEAVEPNSYLVEVLANGMTLEGHSAIVQGYIASQATARSWVEHTVADMGNHSGEMWEILDQIDFDNERAERINRKHARIEEIRRSLARLDRERDSLTFELSQLIGE